MINNIILCKISGVINDYFIKLAIVSVPNAESKGVRTAKREDYLLVKENRDLALQQKNLLFFGATDYISVLVVNFPVSDTLVKNKQVS